MSNVDERKKNLIQEIRTPGSGGTHGREGARAELDVILVEDLVRALEGLTQELQDASTASAKTAWALVACTIALVIATAALALPTVISVLQRH
jgi:hypothetical protein